jgi:anhydro-N-acetylmuramic acid kinase
MANVTIVPPRLSVSTDMPANDADILAAVRAFDTGPGVAIIDTLVRELYPSLRYDIDGALAEQGTPDTDIVTQLLADPYFLMAPPKSTGREYFGRDYAMRLLQLGRSLQRSNEDMIATATLLTARSIAAAYEHFVPEPAHTVIVSGGGANNPTLVHMLQDAVAPKRVQHFETVYYDGEAKEAVAFALLAHLHMMHLPGNVSRATGARGPRILGKLTPA